MANANLHVGIELDAVAGGFLSTIDTIREATSGLAGEIASLSNAGGQGDSPALAGLMRQYNQLIQLTRSLYTSLEQVATAQARAGEARVVPEFTGSNALKKMTEEWEKALTTANQRMSASAQNASAAAKASADEARAHIAAVLAQMEAADQRINQLSLTKKGTPRKKISDDSAEEINALTAQNKGLEKVLNDRREALAKEEAAEQTHNARIDELGKQLTAIRASLANAQKSVNQTLLKEQLTYIETRKKQAEEELRAETEFGKRSAKAAEDIAKAESAARRAAQKQQEDDDKRANDASKRAWDERFREAERRRTQAENAAKREEDAVRRAQGRIFAEQSKGFRPDMRGVPGGATDPGVQQTVERTRAAMQSAFGGMAGVVSPVTGELKTFAGAANESMRAVAAMEIAFSRMTAPTGMWSSALRTLSFHLDATTQAAVSVGVIFAGMGAAIVVALGGAVNAAIAFDKAIGQIHALIGNDAFSQFSDDIEQVANKLGRDTVFSSVEAAEAMGQLIKSGVSLNDVLGDASKAALGLAAATGENVTTSAKAAANVMRIFHDEMASGSLTFVHVADTMTRAVGQAGIEVEQFRYAMEQIGPIASETGQSFDQVSGALGVLSRAGLQSEKAGSSLANMLQRLAPVTARQATMMQSLGLATANGGNAFFDTQGKMKTLAEISSVLADAFVNLSDKEKLQYATMLFGAEGARAAIQLMNVRKEGVDKMIDSLNKEGAAEEATAARMAGLSGHVNALHSSMETLAIQIGASLTPAILPLLKALTIVLNVVSDLPAPFHAATVSMIGMLGVTVALAGAWTALGVVLAKVGTTPAGLKSAVSEVPLAFKASFAEKMGGTPAVSATPMAKGIVGSNQMESLYGEAMRGMPGTSAAFVGPLGGGVTGHANSNVQRAAMLRNMSGADLDKLSTAERELVKNARAGVKAVDDQFDAMAKGVGSTNALTGAMRAFGSALGSLAPVMLAIGAALVIWNTNFLNIRTSVMGLVGFIGDALRILKTDIEQVGQAIDLMMAKQEEANQQRQRSMKETDPARYYAEQLGKAAHLYADQREKERAVAQQEIDRIREITKLREEAARVGAQGGPTAAQHEVNRTDAMVREVQDRVKQNWNIQTAVRIAAMNQVEKIEGIGQNDPNYAASVDRLQEQLIQRMKTTRPELARAAEAFGGALPEGMAIALRREKVDQAITNMIERRKVPGQMQSILEATALDEAQARRGINVPNYEGISTQDVAQHYALQSTIQKAYQTATPAEQADLATRGAERVGGSVTALIEMYHELGLTEKQATEVVKGETRERKLLVDMMTNQSLAGDAAVQAWRKTNAEVMNGIAGIAKLTTDNNLQAAFEEMAKNPNRWNEAMQRAAAQTGYSMDEIERRLKQGATAAEIFGSSIDITTRAAAGTPGRQSTPERGAYVYSMQSREQMAKQAAEAAGDIRRRSEIEQALGPNQQNPDIDRAFKLAIDQLGMAHDRAAAAANGDRGAQAEFSLRIERSKQVVDAYTLALQGATARVDSIAQAASQNLNPAMVAQIDALRRAVTAADDYTNIQILFEAISKQTGMSVGDLNKMINASGQEYQFYVERIQAATKWQSTQQASTITLMRAQQQMAAGLAEGLTPAIAGALQAELGKLDADQQVVRMNALLSLSTDTTTAAINKNAAAIDHQRAAVEQFNARQTPIGVAVSELGQQRERQFAGDVAGRFQGPLGDQARALRERTANDPDQFFAAIGKMADVDSELFKRAMNGNALAVYQLNEALARLAATSVNAQGDLAQLARDQGWNQFIDQTANQLPAGIRELVQEMTQEHRWMDALRAEAQLLSMSEEQLRKAHQGNTLEIYREEQAMRQLQFTRTGAEDFIRLQQEQRRTQFAESTAGRMPNQFADQFKALIEATRQAGPGEALQQMAATLGLTAQQLDAAMNGNELSAYKLEQALHSLMLQTTMTREEFVQLSQTKMVDQAVTQAIERLPAGLRANLQWIQQTQGAMGALNEISRLTGVTLNDFSRIINGNALAIDTLNRQLEQLNFRATNTLSEFQQIQERGRLDQMFGALAGAMPPVIKDFLEFEQRAFGAGKALDRLSEIAGVSRERIGQAMNGNKIAMEEVQQQLERLAVKMSTTFEDYLARSMRTAADTMIGAFKDLPPALQAAIQYINDTRGSMEGLKAISEAFGVSYQGVVRDLKAGNVANSELAQAIKRSTESMTAYEHAAKAGDSAIKTLFDQIKSNMSLLQGAQFERLAEQFGGGPGGMLKAVEHMTAGNPAARQMMEMGINLPQNMGGSELIGAASQMIGMQGMGTPSRYGIDQMLRDQSITGMNRTRLEQMRDNMMPGAVGIPLSQLPNTDDPYYRELQRSRGEMLAGAAPGMVAPTQYQNSIDALHSRDQLRLTPAEQAQINAAQELNQQMDLNAALQQTQINVQVSMLGQLQQLVAAAGGRAGAAAGRPLPAAQQGLTGQGIAVPVPGAPVTPEQIMSVKASEPIPVIIQNWQDLPKPTGPTAPEVPVPVGPAVVVGPTSQEQGARNQPTGVVTAPQGITLTPPQPGVAPAPISAPPNNTPLQPPAVSTGGIGDVFDQAGRGVRGLFPQIPPMPWDVPTPRGGGVRMGNRGLMSLGGTGFDLRQVAYGGSGVVDEDGVLTSSSAPRGTTPNYQYSPFNLGPDGRPQNTVFRAGDTRPFPQQLAESVASGLQTASGVADSVAQSVSGAGQQVHAQIASGVNQITQQTSAGTAEAAPEPFIGPIDVPDVVPPRQRIIGTPPQAAPASVAEASVPEVSPVSSVPAAALTSTTRVDTGFAGVRQASFRQSSTQGQLPDAIVWAICGPAAAAWFVQQMRRNPTLQEAPMVRAAYETARDSKLWDVNVGMHGVGSEASLIQQGAGRPGEGIRTQTLGVNAQGAPIGLGGADWQRIQEELTAHRPVVIDSPNHYYGLSDYDPETQRYEVGGGGDDVGMAPWMTREQLMAHRFGRRNQFSAAPRAAIIAASSEIPTDVMEAYSRGAGSAIAATTPAPAVQLASVQAETPTGSNNLTGSVREQITQMALQRFGPEGAKVVQAILQAEGGEGMGDNGTSFGPFQFHHGGALEGYGTSRNIRGGWQAVGAHAQANPIDAAQYAFDNYLGTSLNIGQQRGAQGRELLDYTLAGVRGQSTGQNYGAYANQGGNVYQSYLSSLNQVLRDGITIRPEQLTEAVQTGTEQAAEAVAQVTQTVQQAAVSEQQRDLAAQIADRFQASGRYTPTIAATERDADPTHDTATAEDRSAVPVIQGLREDVQPALTDMTQATQDATQQVQNLTTATTAAATSTNAIVPITEDFGGSIENMTKKLQDFNDQSGRLPQGVPPPPVTPLGAYAGGGLASGGERGGFNFGGYAGLDSSLVHPPAGLNAQEIMKIMGVPGTEGGPAVRGGIWRQRAEVSNMQATMQNTLGPGMEGLQNVTSMAVKGLVDSGRRVGTTVHSVADELRKVLDESFKRLWQASSYEGGIASAYGMDYNIQSFNQFKAGARAWTPEIAAGQTGAMPAFATGGLVNTPTVARVGERGPEAVIPLSQGAGAAFKQLADILEQYRTQATGGTATTNVGDPSSAAIATNSMALTPVISGQPGSGLRGYMPSIPGGAGGSAAYPMGGLGVGISSGNLSTNPAATPTYSPLRPLPAGSRTYARDPRPTTTAGGSVAIDYGYWGHGSGPETYVRRGIVPGSGAGGPNYLPMTAAEANQFEIAANAGMLQNTPGIDGPGSGIVRPYANREDAYAAYQAGIRPPPLPIGPTDYEGAAARANYASTVRAMGGAANGVGRLPYDPAMYGSGIGVGSMGWPTNPTMGNPWTLTAPNGLGGEYTTSERWGAGYLNNPITGPTGQFQYPGPTTTTAPFGAIDPSGAPIGMPRFYTDGMPSNYSPALGIPSLSDMAGPMMSWGTDSGMRFGPGADPTFDPRTQTFAEGYAGLQRTGIYGQVTPLATAGVYNQWSGLPDAAAPPLSTNLRDYVDHSLGLGYSREQINETLSTNRGLAQVGPPDGNNEQFGYAVPGYAAGGLIMGPTTALVGEAGPEAIISLGQGSLGAKSQLSGYLSAMPHLQAGGLVMPDGWMQAEAPGVERFPSNPTGSTYIDRTLQQSQSPRMLGQPNAAWQAADIAAGNGPTTLRREMTGFGMSLTTPQMNMLTGAGVATTSSSMPGIPMLLNSAIDTANSSPELFRSDEARQNFINSNTGLRDAYAGGLFGDENRALVSQSIQAAQEGLSNWVADSVNPFMQNQMQMPQGVVGFANGGIVTRPTLAMVGERGPEAIMPMDYIGRPPTIPNTLMPPFSIPAGNDPLMEGITQEMMDAPEPRPTRGMDWPGMDPIMPMDYVGRPSMTPNTLNLGGLTTDAARGATDASIHIGSYNSYGNGLQELRSSQSAKLRELRNR